jgi:MFS family permease
MAALSASSATDLPGTPHRVRTAALVNLAAVLERCDEQMLPAVYSFIGASWSATPTQLGYITLCRALVQALSSPIGGIAGHLLHRGRVVGAGCLLWAACTATFAACGSLAAGAAVWAVNGLGLALVLPNTQLFAEPHGRPVCGRSARQGLWGALPHQRAGWHAGRAVCHQLVRHSPFRHGGLARRLCLPGSCERGGRAGQLPTY